MNDQVTRPRTRGKRPRHNYSPASNFDPSSRTRGSSMPCRRVREGLRRSLKPLGFSFSTRIPLVGVFLRRRRSEHMFHYPTRCSIRMTERRRGHSSVVTPIAWPKWRSRRSWTAQVEGGVRGRASTGVLSFHGLRDLVLLLRNGFVDLVCHGLVGRRLLESGSDALSQVTLSNLEAEGLSLTALLRQLHGRKVDFEIARVLLKRFKGY